MKNYKLVSIIVPVYNGEAYLERVIYSLINQTYKNVEIILIDDGSQDASGALCDKYAGDYTNINVIHVNNGGAAKARNFGISVAKGEYIGFVDSDDDVVLDYVENLVETLEKYHLDIMVCGYKKIFEKALDEHITVMGRIDDISVMTGEEALELMLYRKTLTSGPCCKIIKSEIVKQDLFPEGKLFEDLGTVYKWFGNSNRVGYTSKIGYYYWQRLGSCQHSEYNPHKWDLIIISNEILKYVIQYNPKIVLAAHNRLFISAIQVLRSIPYGEYYEQVRELKNIIKKYRKEILGNKKSKLSSRVLGFITCINIDLIRLLGKGYDVISEKFKIVFKY